MTSIYQEVDTVAIMFLCFCLGMFLVVLRLSLWIEFSTRPGKALLPLAWRYVSKRMPPEEGAAWRQAERRGQGDEWLKERWRRSSDR